MSFTYVIDKIRNAEIISEPFRHLMLYDLFTPEHFSAITAVPEINIAGMRSDEELFDTLFAQGWKIISFPGCIVDHKLYLDWHRDKKGKVLNNSACEGFGVTLRLEAPKASVINELTEFLATKEFHETIAERFSIPLDRVFYDGGIQKYLDGYEISPHPDNRRKALTFMVNINPAPHSEKQNHHTHYLSFKNEYRYVSTYWEGSAERERCWVPWSWCQTEKVQTQNNSLVIFSPGNNTMHGVKADYDHLQGQRTQLYGNLWYHENPVLPQADWEDLVIHPGAHRRQQLEARRITDVIRAALPESVKSVVRKYAMGRDVAKQKQLIAGRPKDQY